MLRTRQVFFVSQQWPGGQQGSVALLRDLGLGSPLLESGLLFDFSINPSYLILHYMFLQNNPTTRCIALVPDAFYSHCIALQGGGGSWLNF